MLDVRSRAYGLAAAVVALDRLTKLLIEQRMSFLDSIQVIPGFFQIVRSDNTGMAFGMLSETTSDWRTPALILCSLAAVVILAVMLWRPEKLDRNSLWGFALIMGGAAGNLVDRAMWGRVTDFLLFYVGEHQWPTFNVADSAIVIGSGLLIIDLLIPKRRAANVS